MGRLVKQTKKHLFESNFKKVLFYSLNLFIIISVGGYMKINYKKYVVFPYTTYCLNKAYTKDIIAKYGDQLAFLFQNGFSLQDNSMSAVEEQMILFNYFETYDDFEDLVSTFGDAFSFDEATPVGYKIVDSVLEVVLNNSSWALKNFVNVKIMGDMYKEKIKQMCGILQTVFDSDDVEVVRVMKTVGKWETDNLLDACLELYEDEVYNVLLIKYQELYKQIYSMHKKINRALLNTSEKGKLATMGNVNDELYGSSGGYNPNNDDIIARNGATVFELKTLNDDSISDEDIRIKMLVIAKECVDNGETDKTLTAFVKGDNSKLKEVRKILIDICFSGIMVLLELKHGLTLFEDDSLNSKRAELIAKELTAICNYTKYNCKELM